jgi:hypothetical protein
MAYTTPCEPRSTARSSRRGSRIALRLAVTCALALGTLALAASPQRAAAQDDGTPGTRQPGGLMDQSLKLRPHMLSFFAGLHYGYLGGYGFPLTIGGRYYIPLVHEGFIPSLNDEFGLEFGLDLNIMFLSSFYAKSESTVFGFGVPVDAMWDFHFTPNFDAYAKLGLVLGNVFGSSLYGYGGFWWTIRSAVGLRYKLTDTMYFRAEVGWPAIIAGLGFAL